VIVKLAGNDFVASLDHGISDLWLKSIVQVCRGCGLFEETEGLDNLKGHALTLTSNLEVLERPLGLGAPIAICLHLDGTECVSLFPKRRRE